MIPLRCHPRLAFIALAISVSYGCAAGGHTLIRRPVTDEVPISALSWFGPQVHEDLSSLVRWRRSVGPPVVVHAERPAVRSDRLIIVNWNLHVGGGDIARLFSDLRQQEGNDAPVVFLLQEAYRDGPEVPSVLGPDDTFASLIRGLRRDGGRDEIEAVAAALGLHGYYVPSMRNGGPFTSNEDRGNAILSTVPLTDLTAIELPFERQRRVAIAATVKGETAAGTPWRLRVVSAHLDNMIGARRLWIAGSELGRARQARGLVTALNDESPLVLGADLNTWFGFRDRAYRETSRAFPQTRVTDRRATFRGVLRLDHLFFRLRDGWTAGFHRADHRYDSDHYPLVGTIRFDGTAIPPLTPTRGAKPASSERASLH